MRIWSLHPRYLDRQGLTACWREGLLAQAVLAGRTRGYRQHSQLERFRTQPDPVAAVGAYLEAVAREAADRGLPLRRHPHRPDGPTGRHCTCRCGGAPHPGDGGAGCPRVGPPGGEAGGAQPAAGGGPSRRHQPGRPSVVRGRARPGGAIGSGVHSPQRRPDEQLGDEEAGNEVEATGTGPSPRASSHRSSGSDRNGAMLTT